MTERHDQLEMMVNRRLREGRQEPSDESKGEFS